MKKISYFGKEYTVGDDIKWVATSSYGTVLGFTYEPIQTDNGWAGNVPRRLDKLPSCTTDWKNSLRKVEDIIAKENELKVGDKVMVNDNTNGFKKGQIVELYRFESDGCHLFKGDNDLLTGMCGSHDGAFLSQDEYTVISDAKPHSHADLMLKYALIAQYDDKPWEHFECSSVRLPQWGQCDGGLSFCVNVNYRLKPQEPVVQVGQIWVSKEGVEVNIVNLANKLVFTKIEVGGLMIPWSFAENVFFGNFKRKE